MAEKISLTQSSIDRQNILNNPFAIEKLQETIGLVGFQWKGKPVFLKQQVAIFLEVDVRTIERYLSTHGEELEKNGYTLLRGKDLKDFKELSKQTDINVGHKAQRIGIFNFKSVLNLAMLLSESEKAKEIRSRILSIVIDTIAHKSGGRTKYINQRDEDYLPAAFQEENYRKEFTAAVNRYIDAPNWKYGKYTNLVYESIFKENATEYKKILNLAAKERVRSTMYAEVLDLVASFEAGLAEELENKARVLGRQLSIQEANTIFSDFAKQRAFKPLITKARSKMASRDLCFRDALHSKLEAYIQSVPESDFERFLGEKSKDLKERIDENIAVFKRLKDK
ncbi:hypothetical protein [Maridesulfovibrio salexigens]|uniref:CiaB protein n=1 Tax=Maridesulfovibrio salexigens (strain ATCC 14822 / DSM 2638 / NCIMB 8403 / VKM B-1763) TaxID=526222 RepID=C6BU84_MARSD|nr:hypothetical protein [Maridesulfovibrio salexigens]ACS81793.1 CiaB protein [Maridesulfovibrio salexigens DSM 2638]